MQVATTDLAVILGITERRVQQLETAGILAKAAHGEWDLPAAVQAYIRNRLAAKTKRTATAGKAEGKLKAAKAAREELKLDVERAVLIDTDEALAILDDIIGPLRADLAGVPSRVTREMALRDKIENEIDAALGRAADTLAERGAAIRARGDAGAAAEADDAGSVGEGEP